MNRLQRFAIIMMVAAVIGAGFYGASRMARLREENERLRRASEMARLELSREKHDEALRELEEENEQLKRNASELLKLRGEAGVLQRRISELEQLQNETGKAPRASAEERADVSDDGRDFPGYSTPFAALGSVMRSLNSGDIATFLESLTPEERAREERRLAEQMARENRSRAEIMGDYARAFERLKRFQVVEERVISDDRVDLRVEAIWWGERGSDGGEWMEKELNFRRIDGEWRLDDGL